MPFFGKVFKSFNFIKNKTPSNVFSLEFFKNFKISFFKDHILATGLTHFSRMLHFYTPWKREKTYGFLTFLGGVVV